MLKTGCLMNASLHPPQKPARISRQEAAEKINLAMTRFPLILKILRELSESEVPASGDGDIRHGCERALTAILVEIARLDYAAPGRPSPAELTARNWLNSADATEFIDSEVLQRIELFIDCVLNSGKA
jgi:hypothetical protein